MHWCFHCYSPNTQARGPCWKCGRPVEAPDWLTYEQRLIWALHHPDSDRAMTAARLLAGRGAHEATPTLIAIVREDRDPFLAARALASLVAIEGADTVRELLIEAAESGSFLLARMATNCLALLSPDCNS